MPDEPALLKVGDLLASKYRVQRLLGEGGMGIVVEAHHELLDQRVAVKLLYRDIADAEAESRLLMEARSAAKLQSEHVARVIDVDVGKDGLPFIVMELLEGADLCQVADATGALPRWLVVDYVLQALEGLAHAHGRGIIHRDLKPSNLFLANKADGSQIIKVLDFGISKSADAPTDRHAQQLTGGRTMLGSPPYMSPEQVRSPKDVDHRTDIWSLGICMYELLTNSMPFGGDELQQTFAQILEREPAPIRALVTGVPEGLEQVVMRCLAKNREDRFADVAELATALVPFGSGTWTQAAERIQAVLARALMDDLASGPRLTDNHVSSDRVPIPSSPGRRLDSIQPELHGTASTVARRFTVFDTKKRWVIAGITAPAVIGLLLIGVFAFGKSGSALSGPESDLATRSDPPSPVVDPLPEPATTSSATADRDTSQATPSSLLGAAADATSKSSKAPALSSSARVAVSPARALKPAPQPSAKALPAGLPQTRSGQ